MSADAAWTALGMLWLAGWALYAAVRVDRSLRGASVVTVGCNGPDGGNGRTVCISTVCPSLEPLCACSKRASDLGNSAPEAAPTGLSVSFGERNSSIDQLS